MIRIRKDKHKEIAGGWLEKLLDVSITMTEFDSKPQSASLKEHASLDVCFGKRISDIRYRTDPNKLGISPRKALQKFLLGLS